jgi:hypothetical protein
MRPDNVPGVTFPDLNTRPDRSERASLGDYLIPV